MSTPHLPEHPDWMWRNPDPRPSYDAIVIGGGGHGLATAYYLARNHGLTRVAVLEKGWLAGEHGAQHDDHPVQLPVVLILLDSNRSGIKPGALQRRTAMPEASARSVDRAMRTLGLSGGQA
jgi:choline dehydrogenase-like flavoprotein